MIVCIEAGSGNRPGDHENERRADISHPALAEEMRLVTTEMRAGKPRLEAFKNFATRTKVDDVRSLVAMLVQTDSSGRACAQALRTHADVSRTKRRQEAEEKAAKIGVKLVFSAGLLFVPGPLRRDPGPAVVDYFNVFKPSIVERQVDNAEGKSKNEYEYCARGHRWRVPRPLSSSSTFAARPRRRIGRSTVASFGPAEPLTEETERR